MYPRLLPRPRQVVALPGSCRLADLTRLEVRGLAPASLDLLRLDLPGMDLRPVDGQGCAATLQSGGAGSLAPPSASELLARAPDHAEGFALQVEPGGVAAAQAPAGLWYGLQALVQLRRLAPGELPAALVLDWPALRWRGVHLDLKGYQPRFESLLEYCRLLTAHRVNLLLLEVEDKFAYDGAPGVGVPGAFTAAQFRRLGEHCAALHIEVTPKLQCLGHVDYLLKHPRYRHLREADHPFQYCPRNEEGMALWETMMAELVACFPGHRFFHVGADETGNLGQCPVCRPHPKADSYVHRVGQSLRAVARAGRQPIMWDDILRNLHGNLDAAELERTWVLGRDAILMYWAYGYGGRGNTFPLLPRYLERGMRVWGASGLSGCGPSWIQDLPPLAERALNVSAWTAAAVHRGLEGVVATGWTRIASADPPAEAPEAAWFPLLGAAESTWSGRERSLAEFVRAAADSLFGADPGRALGPALLDGAVDALCDGDGRTPRQPDRFALLRAAAAMAHHERLRREVDETLRMYHGKVGCRLPDYRLRLVTDRVERFAGSLAACRAGLESALAALYEPATVAEVLESRFGRDQQVVEEARRLVAATRLD
ncbi:MAG: family 20 glycosylhydrolase [Gemmatimonadota bacterium]